MEYQRTITCEHNFSGIGLHTGESASVKIKPTSVNSGIVFIRKDIPSSPQIPALVDNVINTCRGTSLCIDGIEIKTVEHILSCLRGLCIDNALIEVYGSEIPIMDGSSCCFVDSICSKGFQEQSCERSFVTPKEPLYLSDNDSSIVLLPCDVFKITYVIDYNHPVLKTQMEEILIEPRTYMNYICMARTYGFIEEVQYLLDNNLALGGRLDNALVIMKDGYSSPLRYNNEPVKHKILDLIGDISLLGAFLRGHIIAIKSSHKLNVEFVKLIKDRYLNSIYTFLENFYSGV
ncbi:MAG: UDP-3-O-(3-hydroxymyristoyl) N-acetylglucosamine deacetylase [bacterium ADurb.Bin363]|nr:MAG: UDP-3-O-(3-hydroxymyristoyl) N-acetylglucosamine deacetylase [bacterium ADurb.Bin363]